MTGRICGEMNMNCLVDGWEIVIGLEMHAQVASKEKLFSESLTDGDEGANTRVTFFDAGFPGTLPVLNKACVDQAIRTGFGIHGTINKVSIFDRKHYFYPDLPSGYQISQFFHPIVTGGYVEILDGGQPLKMGITRIHLEQDAGKIIHGDDPMQVFVDLNRAGIALMEIVTEPDMRSVDQAVAVAKKVHALVQYLGTCEGNMERGNFRVDCNISLHRPGTPFGTRVEIKNLNSFRYMHEALSFEVERQKEVLESGGTVSQETRLYDTVLGVTKVMRDKEDANDYRYFPDPDLKPLVLTDEQIERVRQGMPELPDEKKARYMESFGLSEYDADILSGELTLAAYYESAVQGGEFADARAAYKLVANWIMGDLFAHMKEADVTVEQLEIPPEFIAQLVSLIQKGTISGKMAKTIFEEMWAQPKQSPREIIQRLGLQQISNDDEIRSAVRDILVQNAALVDNYRAGKESLFGFFVGQTMKHFRGQANPEMVNRILKEELDTQ